MLFLTVYAVLVLKQQVYKIFVTKIVVVTMSSGEGETALKWDFQTLENW